MSLAKLTSKGQITLPKPIRDYLELHSGDKVEFVIDAKGRVIMHSKTIDIKEAFGMIKPKKSASVDDMNKSISRKIKRKHQSDCN